MHVARCSLVLRGTLVTVCTQSEKFVPDFEQVIAVILKSVRATYHPCRVPPGHATE
jgi:hypothetical protein